MAPGGRAGVEPWVCIGLDGGVGGEGAQKIGEGAALVQVVVPVLTAPGVLPPCRLRPPLVAGVLPRPSPTPYPAPKTRTPDRPRHSRAEPRYHVPTGTLVPTRSPPRPVLLPGPAPLPVLSPPRSCSPPYPVPSPVLLPAPSCPLPGPAPPPHSVPLSGHTPPRSTLLPCPVLRPGFTRRGSSARPATVEVGPRASTASVVALRTERRSAYGFYWATTAVMGGASWGRRCSRRKHKTRLGRPVEWEGTVSYLGYLNH